MALVGRKAMSGKVMRGIVHGKTIELEDDVGISEGEQVEVVVRRIAPNDRQPGEGFLRTEGALADDSEWDAIMDEIQTSRNAKRPEGVQ
jgi:hypothetical protein